MSKPSMNGVSVPPAEATVVTALLEGKSAVEAVQAAGYTLNAKNSKALADFLWKKHSSGNNALLEAIENRGITPDRIAKKISDKLDAKTTIKVGSGKDAELIDVEDNATQMKALDMVMKTVGGYAPTKTEHVEIKFENILLQIEGEDD